MVSIIVTSLILLELLFLACVVPLADAFWALLWKRRNRNAAKRCQPPRDR